MPPESPPRRLINIDFYASSRCGGVRGGRFIVGNKISSKKIVRFRPSSTADDGPPCPQLLGTNVARLVCVRTILETLKLAPHQPIDRHGNVHITFPKTYPSTAISAASNQMYVVHSVQ
jgi:hypothetical protein